MREILFRGKCVNDGLWVYGSFVMDAVEQMKGLCGADGFIRLYNPALSKMEMFEVDRETVGQYTGLTDNNGKKIFEGDIIQHFFGSPFEDVQNRESGIVFWDAKCCDWRRTSNGALHQGIIPTYKLSEKCVYEVIGNIHDNPEFLGGADNDR